MRRIMAEEKKRLMNNENPCQKEYLSPSFPTSLQGRKEMKLSPLSERG
jgi:hypothetical protein